MFQVKFAEKEMSFEAPLSVFDAAAAAELVSRAHLAALVDGNLVGMTHVLDADCSVQLLTFADELGKKVFRHSAAHVMAQAVKRLYPTAKLTAEAFRAIADRPPETLHELLLLIVLVYRVQTHIEGIPVRSLGRLDVLTALLAAITFGLLPYVAGFATLHQTWKLALIGGVVFALVTWLFTEMQERLSSGPAAKLAPVFSALGLYLAFQCFSGILL